MNLTEIDLADIDWNFNAAWSWSKPIKVAVIALSCILVASAGIYYDILDQLSDLELAEKKEAELKIVFELKHNQTPNLPAYQEQLKIIRQKLHDIIRQMPIEEEISELLIDISQAGVASGLEFKSFKPASPIAKDFFFELPINIEVVGRYDELLLFISELAALPRIVTIHDLTIVPVDKTKMTTQSNMLMSVTVKTYRENGNAQNESK